MVVAIGFQETIQALSDPIRRDILLLLKQGKLSAGDIASHFDVSKATISYHLSTLKKSDLLYETRVKNYIYYDLNTSVLDDVIVWIKQLRREP